MYIILWVYLQNSYFYYVTIKIDFKFKSEYKFQMTEQIVKKEKNMNS